ncbi:MAG TPA: CHASE3 domain-containing protein, partial [Polyangia bacterium]|nr:CHASE3 domain-containing protein [Polyangia bacterium]
MATAEAARTSGAPAHISRESLRAGFFRSGLPAKSQAGFIAAILAVFLIGFFSYRSFLQRAEASRQVARTIDVTDHLDSLYSTFQDAETGQRGYLLTGDERYLEPYHAATAALQAEFPRLRQLLSESPHELEQLEVLERLAANKTAELRQTIDLRRAGRIEQALEIVRTDRGRQAMDEIRKTISRMRTDERELLDVRGRELQATTTVVTSVIWGGSALLLFLIGAAASMSSRDFMAQRTQAWIRTGESVLAGRMQATEHTEVLGQQIATFLGEYLQAAVGAVYFAGSGRTLRRVGGYALPDDGGDAPVGGLTRQTFLDNRAIETQQLPADFFPVSSGVGRAPPRHAFVLPITADGRPNGALELGFLTPVQPHDRELLARIAEPIGLALRATKDRADLRDALEETQRQSEELQTQQEELRVQNEELEQQSRA